MSAEKEYGSPKLVQVKWSLKIGKYGCSKENRSEKRFNQPIDHGADSGRIETDS